MTIITDRTIILGLIGVVSITLFICWLVHTTTKKERFLETEKKQERNESNERYEILPESLYQPQNASSPYPPEPMIPFQIYQPIDVEIGVIKVEYKDDDLEIQGITETVEEVKGGMIERIIRVKKVEGEDDRLKQSTFCTCGGLIHQTCASTEQRVNNYNKGLTEFAKLPNKGWQDVMPYDEWVETPNYYKQSTNWSDVMPYDIYQSNKK